MSLLIGQGSIVIGLAFSSQERDTMFKGLSFFGRRGGGPGD